MGCFKWQSMEQTNKNDGLILIQTDLVSGHSPQTAGSSDAAFKDLGVINQNVLLRIQRWDEELSFSTAESSCSCRLGRMVRVLKKSV